MSNIVIIGAGLTGLSAAYHLEKKGFTNYLIFEQEETIGGLCRSTYQDGFTFDYTGHLLHINDPYFRKFIENIVGFHNLNTLERRASINSHAIETPYPFQINLHGLPSSVIAECIEKFILRPRSRTLPKMYPEWVIKHFGTGLAKHFFFPFQKKIFDFPLSRITPSWTGRFVPQTSLTKMIEGALHTKKQHVGYNATFFYPYTGGIQHLISSLAKKIQKPIHTGFRLTQIDIKNKMLIFSNGHIQKYDYLISTAPLNKFLEGIIDQPTTRLAPAGTKLHCNSVVNFNLGIARPHLSSAHWIYFPEKEFPFYRLGFPYHFSPSNVPNGFSSISGECSYTNRSKQHIELMTEKAITKACQLFDLSEKEVITRRILHLPHAYVLYTPWREKNLPKIMQRLHQFDMYSIGRYGGWKYASMQEAVMDGKKIADQLTVTPARRELIITTEKLQKEKSI